MVEYRAGPTWLLSDVEGVESVKDAPTHRAKIRDAVADGAYQPFLITIHEQGA
jgi:hypothetical protein